MAANYPIAQRLDINWPDATPEDVGRYIGLVAAIEQVADTIAEKNGRKLPTDDDYNAAFAAFCFWPNKPPLAEPFWPNAFAAFSSPDVRQRLRESVGPLAIDLPQLIADGEAAAAVEFKWPTNGTDYLSEVLDLKSLSDGK